MSGIIDEIKNQPEHIRHVFMWLCVIIFFSGVSFVWFHQTSKQVVALLNPQAEAGKQAAPAAPALAQNNNSNVTNTKKQSSPFATFFSSLGDLKANLTNFIGSSKTTKKPDNPSTKDIQPQKFPLSGDK